jgi:hypothetical protein
MRGGHLRSVGVLLGLVALGCGNSDKGAVGNDEGEGSATFVFEAVAGGAQVEAGSYTWTSVVAFGVSDENDELLATGIVATSADYCGLEFTMTIEGAPPSTPLEYTLTRLGTNLFVSRGGAVGTPCDTETPKSWGSQSGVIAVRLESGFINVDFSSIPMAPGGLSTQETNDAVGSFTLSGTVRARDWR